MATKKSRETLPGEMSRKRARELADSFTNGNRGDVCKELGTHSGLSGGLMALWVARRLGKGGTADLAKALEARS